MRSPRISVPITLTATLATITTALYVGWQILVANQTSVDTHGFSAFQWILVIVGTAFFAMIVAWMILQAVWLVREIRDNQRQQTFLDAVTHELHTPLASLQLYLDTLRVQDLDGAKRDEFMAIMAEDLTRLRRTIDQILAAARSDSRTSWRNWVDLVPLLLDCVEEARVRHGFSADSVQLDVPPGAQVRGDPTQLRVVFRNLIENAVRYAGDKLRLEIRVRACSARKLEIDFSDHGLGIAPFELSTMFQRFKRFPKDGFPSRGLGLGLYIVRNIVRSHGGSVRAESEGEGSGSRFLVVLPGQLDGYAHPAR
jgi:two-component system, OmpR family, sensor histidine kinase SenX3